MAAAVDSSRSHKHSNSNSSINKIIQITNIAPQATKDQMQNLFGCIGKIDEIRLYPTVRDVTLPVHSRVCYVKFFDQSCVSVAQHLTNTVYIDRALIVCPVNAGTIPDEFKALEMTNNGTSASGMYSTTQLPPEVENYTEGDVCIQFIFHNMIQCSIYDRLGTGHFRVTFRFFFCFSFCAHRTQNWMSIVYRRIRRYPSAPMNVKLKRFGAPLSLLMFHHIGKSRRSWLIFQKRAKLNSLGLPKRIVRNTL